MKHDDYLGTFHKAYLITLASPAPSTYTQVVLRVARRFLPKLKTESEVATLRYLRANTSVPVPEVYWYDANPYNRLGGEYIVMEKVRGGFLLPSADRFPYRTVNSTLSPSSSTLLHPTTSSPHSKRLLTPHVPRKAVCFLCGSICKRRFIKFINARTLWPLCGLTKSFWTIHSIRFLFLNLIQLLNSRN